MGIQIKDPLEIVGGKDVVGRTARHNGAFAHHDQLIGVGGGQVQVMQYQQQRTAMIVGEARKQRQQIDLYFQIEKGGGLV